MAARVNLPGAAGGEPPREPPAPEQKAEVGPKVVPMPADWAQKFNAQGAVRDELGRVLAVRKLRYSERMKVVAILADDAVKETSDFLVSRKIPIIWGPVRHGPGHNVSTYHRNADDQIVELFCELDQVLDDSLGWFEPRPSHQNFPQKPMVWTDIALANAIRGAQPPASFLE